MVKIHAIINKKTGQAEFEVEGMPGTRCTDITKLLQQGHEVLEEQYTEEYHVPTEMPAYVDEM
jgi:hypothetical protein